MMDFSRFIRPLRLMIVDDELEVNDIHVQLHTAAREVDPLCEVISCAMALEAREKLLELKKEGKMVHAVAMDYKLGPYDIRSIEFLSYYIAQNPAGYWFWTTGHPSDAYPDLLASPHNKRLHARMLTGYNKGGGGFDPSLSDLVSRLEVDVRNHPTSEAHTIILTKRSNLTVSAGSLTRIDDNGQELSILDEIVPSCPLFDDALIIHVPSFPDDAKHFTDALIPKPTLSQARTTKTEQHLLRKAWVARRYFKPFHPTTANEFSGDFDPHNWFKYATQFNLNLTWLDAASERGWSGSLLDACEGGTKLNEGLDAVARANEASAVWTEFKARNFISLFRPWAAVYKTLAASMFFQGKNATSGQELKACDKRLPQDAASKLIKMMISLNANLFIDHGDHFYDIRNKKQVPFQLNAVPTEASASHTASLSIEEPLSPVSEIQQQPIRSNAKRNADKKSSTKGISVKRGRR